MKKNLTYYVIGTALITLTLPTYSYSGERFNRFKKRTKTFYKRVTRVDRNISLKQQKKAKKIAGKILEYSGVPYAEKAINYIDYLNRKTGFYKQQRRILQNKLKNRQR